MLYILLIALEIYVKKYGIEFVEIFKIINWIVKYYTDAPHYSYSQKPAKVAFKLVKITEFYVYCPANIQPLNGANKSFHFSMCCFIDTITTQ